MIHENNSSIHECTQLPTECHITHENSHEFCVNPPTTQLPYSQGSGGETERVATYGDMDAGEDSAAATEGGCEDGGCTVALKSAASTQRIT